ncbi:MAG: hypothetical protein KZQ91_14675 [Candidatus Thiodiazotropha sp. (ex Lucinoma borealis)]|nr:hypothetical protein [Candidatus Thiodiazotropha sp. (ex Lucinoma borealis)]
MLNHFNKTAMVLGLSFIGTVNADSILKYEKMVSEDIKETVTLSITGRWLRIDSDVKGKADYTLMDTGRMLMFEVMDGDKSYRQTHMGKFYWPEDLLPKLKPAREKASVSGVRCQKVHEMGPEKPLAHHCMAAGSALGLNERKTKTLSRLFLVARRMGMEWPGISTKDERQVSVSSHVLENGSSLKFVSVEHKAIPDNRMKIPDDYKQIRVEQKKHNKAG